MKNKLVRFISVLLALCVVLSIPASATGFIKETGDVPYDTFTYWDNANVASNYAVRATGMFDYYDVFFNEDFENVNIASYTDVSVDKDDNVYILDDASSSVHIFNKDYEFVKTIGKIVAEDGTEYDYSGAQGLYVSAKGIIYICDTNNKRVLLCDADGKLQGEPLLLPKSNLIPEDFDYKPEKITVDSSDYIYVLSEGSFYGAILYSPAGEFLGFFGANTVKTTLLSAIVSLWNRLTMTDAKYAQQIRKLPFQFTDLYVDAQDFVYTATGRTAKNIEKGQIKRLSPGGIDILKAENVTFGVRKNIPLRNDIRYPDVAGLAVNSENFIFTYDSSSGCISVFDGDSKMLNTFAGGSANAGDQDGTFMMVSAIEVNSKNDIIVLDSVKKCFTVFKINEYGQLLFDASVLTRNGDYDAARPLWLEVIKRDRNCQVAYSGLARTYYADGDYENAMKYAQIGYDYHTYSLAFEFVRRNIIEDKIYLFAGIILAFVAVVVVYMYLKKKKNLVLVKNRELQLLSRSVLHPSEAFTEIKEKKRGSILIGLILIIVYYITATLKETESGFLFKSPSNTSFNSLLVLLQSLGLVVLWTICNWAICTLQDGKGKLREIFIVASYSIVPLIISNIVYIIASNAILESEAAFLEIFVTVMTLLTAFMLIMGTMIIHDYTFGKFVGTTIMSVLGILIVIFLAIVIVILVQQLFLFLGTVYREFMYR